MKHNKEEAAAFLLDELGGIDERYVLEARAYRRGGLSGGIKALISIGSVAAALVFLTFSLVIINVLIGGRSGGKAALELDGVLDATSAQSTDEITDEMFFSGQALLVWQKADEQTYYTAPVDSSQLRSLSEGLGHGGAYSDSEQPAAKLWLLMGDGTVVSPYLKTSPGNVGYGCLFDYNAEITPSSSTVSLINQILNSN